MRTHPVSPASTVAPADPVEVRRIVLTALDEDLGPGDLTALATIPADLVAEGRFVARAAGIVAGIDLVESVARALAAREGVDPDAVHVRSLLADGDAFAPGDALAELRAPARVLLGAERVTLNLLCRLAGIAALTRRYVDLVAGTPAQIVDTRKTTPGLRALEKLAVRAGGGVNHRMGLYDEAMVKDNHLAALAQGRAASEGARAALGLAAAVAAIRARRPGARVTVEIDGLEAIDEALTCGADIVLLDNFALPDLRAAVERAAARGAERPRLEASGGVRLDTVRAIAETGVDRISVGGLTHQATSIDVGLDLDLRLAPRGG